jgi:hypothetical protein
VSFEEEEDDVGWIVGLWIHQSFNYLRHALSTLHTWSNADDVFKARFQVRKTLAAAKAA